MSTIRVIGVLVAAVIGLSACASRPSEEDLTNAILVATNADPDVDVSDVYAACIASELLGSSLSDTTLSGLAENFDSPEVLETEINAVEPAVTAAALACDQATP